MALTVKMSLSDKKSYTAWSQTTVRSIDAGGNGPCTQDSAVRK